MNEQGNKTRQRWKIEEVAKVTVDFLIPPSLSGDRGGGIRDIAPDFAALIAPGLDLAFMDRQRVTVFGQTILGENFEALRFLGHTMKGSGGSHGLDEVSRIGEGIEASAREGDSAGIARGTCNPLCRESRPRGWVASNRPEARSHPRLGPGTLDMKVLCS